MKKSSDFTPQKRCSEYEHFDTHENLADNAAIENEVLADYCRLILLHPEYKTIPIEQKLESMLMERGFVWQTDKHRKTELWLLKRRAERFLLRGETRPIVPLTDEDRILLANENYLGEDIYVEADYLVATPNRSHVNVVRLRGGQARPDTDELSSEWETYLLMELGRKLYPDAVVTAEINYLQDENPTKEMTILDENFFSPASDSSHKTTRVLANDNNFFYFAEKARYEEEHPVHCHDCGNCPNNAKCNYERPLTLTDTIRTLNADNVPLTIQQRQGATDHSTRVLIKAKAGSGKTTVTALNCLDAIKKGENPSNILMVSYTVNGAQEIVNRVQSFLNGTPLSEAELEIQRRLGTNLTDTSMLNLNAQEIIHGTFNSFCQGLIDENYEALGYERAPRVITDDKRLELINRLQDKYPKIPGLKYKQKDSVYAKNPFNRYNAADALTFVSTLFAEVKKHDLSTQSAESIVEAEVTKALRPQLNARVKPLSQRDLFNAIEYLTVMFEEYQMTLKEQCLIEYSDHPVLVSQLHDQNLHLFDNLHYIYVDEFQDTTEAFLALINRMCDHMYVDPATGKEVPAKLFCVGDDKQALFRFANATDRGILNFESIFGESNVIDIRENFRCSKQAIEFVNKLNPALEARFGAHVADPLVATAGEGNEVVVKAYNNVRQEYADIARMVKEDIRNGIPPQEIYIQALTRRELTSIGSELAKQHIPVVTKCAVSIIENSNVQAALCFLRSAVVLANSSENKENRLENDFLSFVYTMRQNETEDILTFNDVVEEARELQETLRGESKLKTVEDLLVHLRKLDPEGKDECYQEFLTDYTLCKSLQEVKEAYSTFLNFGKTRTFKRDGEYNAVSLGTPWAIKGLEGQSVYTVFDGYDEKDFYTFTNNQEKKNRITDRVNLAYTSCTRIAGTKEYVGEDGEKHKGALHVTGTRFFAHDQKTNQRYENRFLDAAFDSVGRPFVVDRNIPNYVEEVENPPFPTKNEYFHESNQPTRGVTR